jgi:hypothetical protein
MSGVGGPPQAHDPGDGMSWRTLDSRERAHVLDWILLGGAFALAVAFLVIVFVLRFPSTPTVHLRPDGTAVVIGGRKMTYFESNGWHEAVVAVAPLVGVLVTAGAVAVRWSGHRIGAGPTGWVIGLVLLATGVLALSSGGVMVVLIGVLVGIVGIHTVDGRRRVTEGTGIP